MVKRKTQEEDRRLVELLGADWYVAAEQRCARRMHTLGIDGTLAKAVANLALGLCIAGYRRGAIDGKREAAHVREAAQ